MPVCTSAHAGYGAPSTDAQRGWCHDTRKARRGIIFCDSIYMTGKLLMASLLRYRRRGSGPSWQRCVGAGDAVFFRRGSRADSAAISDFCGRRTGEWLRACTAYRHRDVGGV
jgi:hypothetical protein